MAKGIKEPVEARLHQHYIINEVTDCWEWIGGTNNIGYGFIRDGKRMRTAHRVSYEIHNNTTIPKYMCVCHTCDNPKCVNPAHLWLGTRKDNTRDMLQKGRGKPWGGKTLTGFKHKLKICEHCNKSCPTNLFTRYHGDNCKHKPKE
jgi:hypothetical protein